MSTLFLLKVVIEKAYRSVAFVLISTNSQGRVSPAPEAF